MAHTENPEIPQSQLNAAKKKAGHNFVLLQEGTIKRTEVFVCSFRNNLAPLKSLPVSTIGAEPWTTFKLFEHVFSLIPSPEDYCLIPSLFSEACLYFHSLNIKVSTRTASIQITIAKLLCD